MPKSSSCCGKRRAIVIPIGVSFKWSATIRDPDLDGYIADTDGATGISDVPLNYPSPYPWKATAMAVYLTGPLHPGDTFAVHFRKNDTGTALSITHTLPPGPDEPFFSQVVYGNVNFAVLDTFDVHVHNSGIGNTLLSVVIFGVRL